MLISYREEAITECWRNDVRSAPAIFFRFPSSSHPLGGCSLSHLLIPFCTTESSNSAILSGGRCQTFQACPQGATKSAQNSQVHYAGNHSDHLGRTIPRKASHLSQSARVGTFARLWALQNQWRSSSPCQSSLCDCHEYQGGCVPGGCQQHYR